MKRERLRVSHMKKTVHAGTVLEDISLNIYEGERLGLLGLHDEGKSTILDILSGKTSYDSGTVFFNEKKITGNPLSFTDEVGIVRSRSALVPSMSVAENIFILRKYRHSRLFYSRSFIEAQTRIQLAELGIDIDPRTPVKRLTEVQRYIVEIARAYILGAQLILIDDFSGNYSRNSYKDLMALISALTQRGVSFLIAGSHFSYMDEFCDRIAILSGRRIVITASEGRGQYRAQYEELLSGINRIESSSMHGFRPGDQVLFEAKNLSFRHLASCSFQVHAGEIVALLDPRKYANEALLSLISNPLQVHGGDMMLYNKPFCEPQPRSKVFYTDFRLDHLLFSNLTVRSNILMCCHHRFFFKGLLKKQRLDFVMKDFCSRYKSKRRLESKYVSELCASDKMALYLFCMRLIGAKVIFLKDPLQATDIVTNRMIMTEIQEMAKEGVAICIMMNTFDQDPAIFDQLIRIPYQ